MATKAGRRRRDLQNCRRKIAYETFRDAKLAARLVRQLISELVLAYPCPLARGTQGHYHIGHPPQDKELSDNARRY